MIGRLSGTIVDTASDDTVVIDVGGVGYELMVPTGTIGRLKRDGSSAVVTIFVHTHAKENALDLYGFSSLLERRAFRTLMTVSGIGPRNALGILSVLSAEELAACIQARDIKGLMSVPGVGKKTAERLVLELKDKLTFALSSQGMDASVKTAPRHLPGSVQQQLVEVLVRMGYRPSEAQQAVGSMGDIGPERELKSLLREALGLLSR